MRGAFAAGIERAYAPAGALRGLMRATLGASAPPT
jgi:hypothetical protein